MIQILNLRSLFEVLAPELAARLAGSSMAGWQGDLACEKQVVLLQIGNGRVDVNAGPANSEHCIEGGQEIARLAVGVDVPSGSADA